jgi:hypothetical protein
VRKRHPEHVCDHVFAEALGRELAGQVEKDLIRHPRQGRAQPADRGDVREQHHRLLHDAVDQQLRVQDSTSSSSLPGPCVRC